MRSWQGMSLAIFCEKKVGGQQGLAGSYKVNATAAVGLPPVQSIRLSLYLSSSPSDLKPLITLLYAVTGR